MQLQESGEMYLETIYVLCKEKKEVRSIDVAEGMGFSKPSVSRAMKLLKESGYIIIDKDGFITLTNNGIKAAEHTYERHTVISQVLMKLGVDKENAVADACRIEHVISDASFDAIKKHISNHSK